MCEYESAAEHARARLRVPYITLRGWMSGYSDVCPPTHKWPRRMRYFVTALGQWTRQEAKLWPPQLQTAKAPPSFWKRAAGAYWAIRINALLVVADTDELHTTLGHFHAGACMSAATAARRVTLTPTPLPRVADELPGVLRCVTNFDAGARPALPTSVLQLGPPSIGALLQ